MDARHILNALLGRLWENYCARVPSARRYRELIEEKGGRVVNDHIAFRTFNTRLGNVPSGIIGLSRIFEPLGYRAAGSYEFTDKHLIARHYQHDDPVMPKIFISQLQVDELPGACATLINEAVAGARDSFRDHDPGRLIDAAYDFITTLPWAPPRASIVEHVNKESQYAAWTLLHGYNVNHFTAYINEQNVADWPDIDTTVAGLIKAGVAMKDSVEGEPGSKLRQTATQAVDEDCDVRDDQGRPSKLRWSYAYYELAERGDVEGPDGKPTRFQGFLGPQAALLFEMTKR